MGRKPQKLSKETRERLKGFLYKAAFNYPRHAHVFNVFYEEYFVDRESNKLPTLNIRNLI